MVNTVKWWLDYWMTLMFIYQCSLDKYMAEMSGNLKRRAQAASDKAAHERRRDWLELNREAW